MSVWLRLVEGLRYIRKLPRVYSILIATIFMNAWVFTFFPLLSVFARDILGRSEQDLGVMAGSYGLGALIGLCFVHHARRLCSDYAVLAGSCVLTCVVILGFSMSSFYSLSLVFLFLGGVGQAGFTSMQSGIILRDVSEEMRGRAMATLVLVIGAGPLGGLQSTVMVAWLGAPATVAILSREVNSDDGSPLPWPGSPVSCSGSGRQGLGRVALKRHLGFLTVYCSGPRCDRKELGAHGRSLGPAPVAHSLAAQIGIAPPANVPT